MLEAVNRRNKNPHVRPSHVLDLARLEEGKLTLLSGGGKWATYSCTGEISHGDFTGSQKHSRHPVKQRYEFSPVKGKMRCFSPPQLAQLAGLLHGEPARGDHADVVVKEAGYAPFCPSRGKFHTVFLRGVGTPECFRDPVKSLCGISLLKKYLANFPPPDPSSSYSGDGYLGRAGGGVIWGVVWCQREGIQCSKTANSSPREGSPGPFQPHFQ